jgi:16S rRNA G1207 methylase RsmC
MFQTNSNFNTPYNTIRELLYMIKLKDNSTILEPCAGEGNFVIELKQWNKTLTVDACEINSQFEFALKLSGADNIYIKNFFELPITKYDYVLSNPPFNQVERFLRKSYLHLKDDGQMIMLLQLSLLGGKKMKLNRI